MRPKNSRRGAIRTVLRDQDIDHISKTFRTYAETQKYARIVPLTEIEQNDWNLNISRYVDTAEEEKRIDVAQAVRKLRHLEQDRSAAEASSRRWAAPAACGSSNRRPSAKLQDALAVFSTTDVQGALTFCHQSTSSVNGATASSRSDATRIPRRRNA